MIKAVFWDMDGTIFDNESLYETIVDNVLEKHDLKLPSPLPAGTCLNSLWAHVQKHYSPKITFKELFEEITAMSQRYPRALEIRPGVKETMEFFSQKNIPQTCVSNSHQSVINDNFIKTGLRSYFCHIIGRDAVKVGKPDPEPYLKACAVNNILPQDGIAIEDTVVGLESAKKAGLKVYIHPTELTKKDDFTGAEGILETPLDLMKILNLK